MKAFRLSRKQRYLFSDKLLDLAHFVGAGLVVGEVVSDSPRSSFAIVSGLVMFAVLYYVGYNLSR